MPHPQLKAGQGKFLPDLPLDKAKVSDFDMVVMLCGRNGTPPLRKTPRVA